jgi:broad specificity phosphatase PhoE
MSVLTLMRHGQASFFADNYDQLTPLGEQQSRLLGEHWLRQGVQFDAVYAGPRARQRRSAELAGAAFRQAGQPWPEPMTLPELDEFDLHGVFHQIVPELAQQNLEFAALLQGYRQTTGERDRLRAFQHVFEPLLVHWQLLPGGRNGLESWLDFRDRVERALRQIVETGSSGRRIALFTSGGFIGTAVRWALAAPDRSALELAWRLRNASLTEFVFTRNRVSLETFNTVSHLPDPALWTYR